MSTTAQEFYQAFDAAFAPAATASGLVRGRGKALKWVHACAGGTTARIGFRLNRKNLPGYPGEFMPDVFWDGRRKADRDSGEVSFYQYTLPSENDAVGALRRSVIEGFIAEMHLESERQDPKSLTALMASACDLPIVPHQPAWLPYWNSDDARAWGGLFAGFIGDWMVRFLASPETLDSYCHRVVWGPKRP